MSYEYEEFIDAMRFGLTMSDRDSTDDIWKMVDEVVNKAKLYDKLVELYPQKDEIPSDEFFMMMGYIIEGYKDELKEVHSKAKAFDEISNLIEENYVDYGENNLEDVEAIVNEYWEDK